MTFTEAKYRTYCGVPLQGKHWVIKMFKGSQQMYALLLSHKTCIIGGGPHLPLAGK